MAYALNDTTALDLRWHGNDAEVGGTQFEDALVASVLLSF
jgi:hypothetical protein